MTLEELHGERATERTDRLLQVFEGWFGPLMRSHPDAFQAKFRKMAASPFAFYRGSACLFYADIAQAEDPFLDDRSGRVWIQGDLHCGNFGTYMNDEGTFVFDVNDFDEAYVGPFTWDLKRLAASLALLGYQKALSDETIRDMVRACAGAYVTQVGTFASDDSAHHFNLNRNNTEGALRQTILAASARTRVGLLEETTVVEDFQRRFRYEAGASQLELQDREDVEAAFHAYVDTIPESKGVSERSHRIKDVVARSGVGIGSAGLPSYNLLLEGHTEALENDVVVYLKQSREAAPSQWVLDPSVAGYFDHEGHRTVVSQRALQANSDPWLGHAVLHGQGCMGAEVSPYTNDLDWDRVNSPDEILQMMRYLGMATAKIHCVSDAESDQTLVPYSTGEAIAEAISGREEAFLVAMADFADRYGCRVRDDHRLFVDVFRNGALGGS